MNQLFIQSVLTPSLRLFIGWRYQWLWNYFKFLTFFYILKRTHLLHVNEGSSSLRQLSGSCWKCVACWKQVKRNNVWVLIDSSCLANWTLHKQVDFPANTTPAMCVATIVRHSSVVATTNEICFFGSVMMVKDDLKIRFDHQRYYRLCRRLQLNYWAIIIEGLACL